MAPDQTTTPIVQVPDPTEGRGPRRVLVTGADSGIGKACAVALAEAGFDIGITWHGDRAGAQRTAGEVGAPAAAARSPSWT